MTERTTETEEHKTSLFLPIPYVGDDPSKKAHTHVAYSVEEERAIQEDADHVCTFRGSGADSNRSWSEILFGWGCEFLASFVFYFVIFACYMFGLPTFSVLTYGLVVGFTVGGLVMLFGDWADLQLWVGMSIALGLGTVVRWYDALMGVLLQLIASLLAFLIVWPFDLVGGNWLPILPSQTLGLAWYFEFLGAFILASVYVIDRLRCHYHSIYYWRMDVNRSRENETQTKYDGIFRPLSIFQADTYAAIQNIRSGLVAGFSWTGIIIIGCNLSGGLFTFWTWLWLYVFSHNVNKENNSTAQSMGGMVGGLAAGLFALLFILMLGCCFGKKYRNQAREDLGEAYEAPRTAHKYFKRKYREKTKKTYKRE